MGGRGASSGVSNKGKKYGTQYKTLFSKGNIKFISKQSRNSEPLMETMTKGRVYAFVGGNDVISITYMDKENKRIKSINLDHYHQKMKLHVHHGYFHNENDGIKGATQLTTKEKAMVDRVQREWYNYLNGRR